MQLHFEHYLKELCDIYIDVLGKCQYSGFAGYVEELEQRKKGISFSIKSNFKEILSSLPYVQKVESLNKRFPGFKYLTDVFFNDEDSFSQLSQARLNFHSMEFIVGENDIVIIAGKGHEQTQKIGHTVLPFSDQETVREAIRGRHV